MTDTETTAVRQSPTVVLVPGLWHGAWAWDHVVGELEARGISHHAVTFPGEDRLEGDPTFAGHIAHLRAELAAISGPKVVVAHSYGGAVVSEAVEAADVESIVFVAAFALEAGESIADVVDGRPRESDAVAADNIGIDSSQLVVDRELALTGFYQDCDPAEAEAAFQRLTPEDPSTRVGRVSRAAWRDVPSHFVVCTQDRAVTVERQRMMAARLKSSTDIDSGHCPMLSRPVEFTDLIVQLTGLEGWL